jgi:hypothetical protein
MAGYSGTPLWKKPGYAAGTRALAIGAPGGYRKMLVLPPAVDVSWMRSPEKGMGFGHLFALKAAVMADELRRLRGALAPHGVVTEDTIREVALPLGFVDVKVGAVDETWSGLKLMIRWRQR